MVEREHQDHLHKVHLKGLQLSVGHRRSPSLLSSQTFHPERHPNHSLEGDSPCSTTTEPDDKMRLTPAGTIRNIILWRMMHTLRTPAVVLGDCKTTRKLGRKIGYR